MLFTSISIPENMKRPYTIARIILYSITIISISLFIFQTVFPTLNFSFNFRTPDSSKNNLINPQTKEALPNTNGKVGKDESLSLVASALTTFSQARIQVLLEKKSQSIESLQASIERSYQSFLFPNGPIINSFPSATLYKIDNAYYELRGTILFPFLSESAYHSRYRDTDAQNEEKSFIDQYILSDTLLGYRIGSTVSFADGVFLIVSETEMRPFGDAEIFLNLGYRFENVIPASEEELSIYKKGKIITLGMQHPDGTLFFDQDTKAYYLIENKTKRLINNTEYKDFLKEKQIPIIASSKISKEKALCTLEPDILGQSLSCQTSVASLPAGFGNDFILTLQGNDTDIDINTVKFSLHTEANKENMLTVLSKVKQRILARFGLIQ